MPHRITVSHRITASWLQHQRFLILSKCISTSLPLSSNTLRGCSFPGKSERNPLLIVGLQISFHPLIRVHILFLTVSVIYRTAGRIPAPLHPISSKQNCVINLNPPGRLPQERYLPFFAMAWLLRGELHRPQDRLSAEADKTDSFVMHAFCRRKLFLQYNSAWTPFFYISASIVWLYHKS